VAILVTAVALAFVNLGLALLIVAAIGVNTGLPPWVGGAVLAAGIVTGVLAAWLWQSHLRALREH
jgi:hypothetical protein